MAVEQDFIKGNIAYHYLPFSYISNYTLEGKYHPALIYLPFVANDLWSFSTKIKQGTFFWLLKKMVTLLPSSSEYFSSRKRPLQTEGVTITTSNLLTVLLQIKWLPYHFMAARWEVLIPVYTQAVLHENLGSWSKRKIQSTKQMFLYVLWNIWKCEDIIKLRQFSKCRSLPSHLKHFGTC